MYCQFCGAGIPDGDQFCGQCGARAPAASEGSTSGSTYGQTSGESPREVRRTAQPHADPAASGTRPPETYMPSGQTYYDRDPHVPAAVARYTYAGFWLRFAAWILDTLFALVLAAIPGAIIAVILVLLVEGGQDPPLTFAEAEQQDEDTGNAAVAGFFLGFTPLILAYWYIGTALGGAWGKRIFGLRILKYEDGARPGFGTAAIRVLITWLISFISIASLLDHLWAIWDKDKQTWHDKAAGTVVVRV